MSKDTLKRRQASDDVVLGGVCGGIADHYRFEDWQVRLLFAISATLSGLGIIIYVTLWVILSEKKD